MIVLRCPICDRREQGDSPAAWPHHPFCSDRCRRIDLGRWLGEAYRLPAEDDEPDAETPDDHDPP
jgi:endogenous inhibitor of DNA gyrase (YacG/DUF329 family)